MGKFDGGMLQLLTATWIEVTLASLNQPWRSQLKRLENLVITFDR